MKIFFKEYKIFIIPVFYILFYFWDAKIILFEFLFSNLSKEIFKFIYFREGETLLVKPLDDILIFSSLCWFFILMIICSLFYFIKEGYLRKGIYVTLLIHIIFLIYLIIIMRWW